MIDDDKKDFFWIVIVSALILFWGSIPTWAGYRAENDQLKFRGLYYDSQDYAAHIAMMEAGKQGEWTYQFRFTTESFNPAYVRLFYIFLGHLSRLLNLSAEFVFHGARWILGLIALFALYRLMQQIFRDHFWAVVAFLLASLGSGLGWLQVIFNLTSTAITPIDFWLIDSYVFFSLSVFPHFAFVTAAMCIALILWLDYLENLNKTNVVWIMVIVVLVQFINPIAFATVDAAFLGAAVFSWWNTRRNYRPLIVALGMIAIAQIPLLVYNVTILSQNLNWRQYTSQHQTLSPPPDYYFWGFALFWPLAILGALRVFRQKPVYLGASIFWILAAFFFAYAPLYTQQRFLQNITIPLGILATQGLMGLFEQRSSLQPSLKRWQRLGIVLFVFLTSLSSIQLSLGRSLYLQTYPEDFFYPASLDAAAEWIRKNAHYNDFVLAAEQTSQTMAQKAGVRVYFGHQMETLNYKTKQAMVQSFYKGELPSLASQPIEWVIYGPGEREINPNFRAPENLELVYSIKDLQIYQVK